MIQVFNKVSSKKAMISVGFNSGSRLENISKYNYGISHVLEHCIFKGTPNRTAEEIMDQVEFLGGQINAFTSHEKVVYYIRVPEESIEEAMEIISDIVFNSMIPDEEFKKEIEVVKEEEVSRGDSIGSFLWQNFSKNFFKGYPSIPVIGYKDSIAAITPEEVRGFYKDFCGRENAVVSLTMNCSKKKAKDLMKKYFGKATGKIKRSYKFDCGYSDYDKVLELTKAGISHTYCWVGHKSFESSHNDIYALKILNKILGGGLDSRLVKEVREKRGLVYSISSSNNSFRESGCNIISFSTRDKNLNTILEIIDVELKKITAHGVSDRELQKAKNMYRSSFYDFIEDPESINMFGISNAMFKTRSLDEVISLINSVTVEDIKRVANDVFVDEKMIMIVRGEE
jgi:predicted Zn-dependent peptidase